MAFEIERKNATFNVRSMTYLLDGGKERTQRKEKLRDIIQNDPVFSKEDRFHISRKEAYKRSLQKASHLIEKLKMENIVEQDDIAYCFDVVDETLPWSVHRSMFIPTLMGQCTEEQKKIWLTKALNYEILGTYAQTELGHGTFVRGIETTAVYDKYSQEFVLNTPTLTSIKFWPGGLGKTVNHVVLMARLIIDNKDYGMHPFILQIRSLEDHKTLPGITAGDIGSKMGWNTIDNNVRIPRTNMLMRFSSVSPDGKYSKPPHEKIAYGTMILIRANLVLGSSSKLAQACTIATRYSCLRQQGFLLSHDKEMAVIDYQMQQYRLFPLIAAAYTMNFSAKKMQSLYKELVKQIDMGDFSFLPEVHATSAGLKAYCTWLGSQGIEECRLCCGGHGFLNNSGIPYIYSQLVPACTYEGENYVLIQQTCSYLLKAYQSAKSGKSLVGSVKYIGKILNGGYSVCKANNEQEIGDLQVLVDAYEHRSSFLIGKLVDKMEKLKKQGIESSHVTNETMIDTLRVTKAHCYLFLLSSFIEGINAVEEPAIKEVLQNLCQLFGLYHIEKDFQDFLEDGFMTPLQGDMIRNQIKLLLKQIRPNAIALVDAFNFSDFQLNSTLGRYDGNAYEALLEVAKKEPLNKEEVVDGYKEYIKPLLKQGTIAKL